MGHFDWDSDELLNFDYGKPIPDRTEREVVRTTESQNMQQVGHSQSDEARLYAAMRKESEEQRLRAEIDAKMRAQRDSALRERQEAREREIRQAQLRAYQESEKRAQERVREERERQQRAQYEAQLRAQQEAQQRAQYEAQLRAQQEAQQRAQYEAQLRAQQEAQQRAQYEAQLRAQQEAQQRAQYEAQVRAKQEAELRAQQDEEIKRQTQIEAYERYRAQSRSDATVTSANNNEKRRFKKKDKEKTTDTLFKFTKSLSVFYLIFAVVFAVSMTVMNILPILYLVIMIVVLAALSFILVKQLRKKKNKTWSRVAAMILAILLMIVYGVGTAYALGTLSFLGTTTVDNDKRVAKITETPFNVVMTGIDVTGTVDEQGRSDVNMIVTVNPQTATILMTSIPRDYEIRMPDKGYATDKLTHTGFYSVDTTIQSEEDLLDIEANYYVKVNFSTVVNFINAIGGVDVYSEYEFVPVKMKSWTVQKGVNHMSGDQALAFARERKAFQTGDNQRIKNQQAVFEALIEKATSSRTVAISYGKILNQLSDYFEMSFSSSEIRSLVKYQIAKSPNWKIYKNTLSGGDASKTTYTGGSQPLYVMEQNPTSVANAKELINAVVTGQELQEDDDGNVTVVGAEDSSESETTDSAQ